MSALMTLDTDLACRDERERGGGVSDGFRSDRGVGENRARGGFGYFPHPSATELGRHRLMRPRQPVRAGARRENARTRRFARASVPLRARGRRATRRRSARGSRIRRKLARDATRGSRACSSRDTYLDLGRLEGGDGAGEGGGNAGHDVRWLLLVVGWVCVWE